MLKVNKLRPPGLRLPPKRILFSIFYCRLGYAKTVPVKFRGRVTIKQLQSYSTIFTIKTVRYTSNRVVGRTLGHGLGRERERERGCLRNRCAQ
jgi:hypothetical protein